MSDPLKAIRELHAEWREYVAKMEVGYHGLVTEESRIMCDAQTSTTARHIVQLESALTAAEQELGEREGRVSANLGWRLENRPRRGSISRDGGRTWQPHEMVDEWWFVDDDGRETLAMNPRLTDLWNEYLRSQTEANARVAAAFALALRIIEESPTWNKHKGASLCHCEVCAYVRGNASEIRALTPPEATAALEKMLLEARRETLKQVAWKLTDPESQDNFGTILDVLTLLREDGEQIDAQLAALTGEKRT